MTRRMPWKSRRGVTALGLRADREDMTRKRLRSPYMGLVASLLGFVLSGVSYLRASK